MKRKNPILNFRIEVIEEPLKPSTSGNYCLIKGIYNTTKAGESDFFKTHGTLITRTRESIDMAESTNS